MKSLFLYTICCAIVIASARKVYDVEEEAMKLYGEDLNSVLLRFRKSPDYLTILQDKVTGMLEELSYMMIQVQEYCTNEMNDKILLTLGVTTSTMSPSVLRSKIQRKHPLYSPMQKMRGLEDHHIHQPPVSRLDHYPKIHHALSIANLNYFKAMGFEYAGRAIHTVIKHMGSDEAPVRSTQQPYYDGEPNKNTKSTAESPHDHQVKPSSDADITHPHGPELTTQPAGAAAEPPDLLRYSY